MEPGIYALLGTLVGGGITVLINWLQQKSQSKRDMINGALNLALVDYKQRIELIAASKEGGKMSPIELFVNYHYRVLKAMRNEPLSKKELEVFITEQRLLEKAVSEINEAYSKNKLIEDMCEKDKKVPEGSVTNNQFPGIITDNHLNDNDKSDK